MKLHVFNLLLLIITICFFQSTHEYRLSNRKRQITEYTLASFIVNTCSGDPIDSLIQNLCDQTLQSALMGNLPFLIEYCKEIDGATKYCHKISFFITLSQNLNEKQSVQRRHVRSLNEEEDSKGQMPQMDYKFDVELTTSMQTCMKKLEEQALDALEFCKGTLQERYSDIEHLCETHPDFDYCRLVRFPSSFYFWLLSSSHSVPTKLEPLIFSSTQTKATDVNANSGQQSINNNNQERSS